MATPDKFEANAAKLVAAELDVAAKRELVSAIKDGIEIARSEECANFLKHYLPAFRHILHTVPPQTEKGPEQSLRNTILEIFHRLPYNEALKEHVSTLMSLCLRVLDGAPADAATGEAAVPGDNEENALLALRVVFDLHKNFRPDLEKDVQPLVSFITKTYSSFADTANSLFAATATHPLAPGRESFLVIAECPLLLMFLLQAYSRTLTLTQPSIEQTLLPLMTRALGVREPEALQQAPHLGPLKAAQVKTTTFLVHLLRLASGPTASPQLVSAVQPHSASICAGIVTLLASCPDHVVHRKELLVACRHILQTKFAQGLYDKVDALMNERVLVGVGLHCHEALRPLAFALLAELVHHVRAKLSLVQQHRVVQLFTRNVHDVSLPLSVRTTCVRILLYLVESIFSKRGQDVEEALEARKLLSAILLCFLQKLRALRHHVDKLVVCMKEAGSADGAAGAAAAPALVGVKRSRPEDSAIDATKLFEAALDPQEDLATSSRELLHTKSSVTELMKEAQDTRQLLKTVFYAMRTLLHSLAYYSRVTTQSALALVTGGKGLTDSEIKECSALFTSGARCLKFFEGYETYTGSTSSNEPFDLFAKIFEVLEPRNFIDLFHMKIGAFIECMFELPKLVQVVGYLLSSHQGAYTADVLLTELNTNYLMKIESSGDSKKSEVITRIYQHVFAAVTLNSPPNQGGEVERVLLPHLSTIVNATLDALTTKREPTHHIMLLRSLFRSLQDGKPDHLLRDFKAMLPHTLDVLIAVLKREEPNYLQHRSGRVLKMSQPKQTRRSTATTAQTASKAARPLWEQIAELCLALPVRLQHLLPHLHQLMEPLVLALHGGDDLLCNGLYTFEYWIDSLNPEFLEPAMADVETELMLSLWGLLRLNHVGQSSRFSLKALQLLGKLGGRNRRFLRGPLLLEHKANPEHGLRLVLTFGPSTSFLVPLDRCVQLTRSVLGDTTIQPYYRLQALQFLRACLVSILNVPSVSSDLEGAPSDAESAAALWKALTSSEMLLQEAEPSPDSGHGISPKTRTQLHAEANVFRQIVAAVLTGGAMTLADDAEAPEAKDDDNASFADGVTRHFAILFASAAGSDDEDGVASLPPLGDGDAKSSSPEAKDLRRLDPTLFLDVLMELLADGSTTHTKAALHSLDTFVDATLALHEANVARPPPGDAAAMDVDASAAGEEATAAPDAAPPPPVLEKLLSRLLHMVWCVHGARGSGPLMATALVLRKIPGEWMQKYLPSTTSAVLQSMRNLHMHAKGDLSVARDVLLQALEALSLDDLTTTLNGNASGDAHPDGEGGGAAAQAPEGTDADAQALEGAAKDGGAAEPTEAAAAKDEGTAADGAGTTPAASMTALEMAAAAASSGEQQADQTKQSAGGTDANNKAAASPATAGLRQIVTMLSREIFSTTSSLAAADAARDAMLRLAERAKCSPYALISTVLGDKCMGLVEQLLRQLLKNRTVRPQQMQALKAMTFCLSSDPPLLDKLPMEVLVFLSDAVTLVELESYANMQLADLQRLRAAAIDVLAAAIAWAPFETTTNETAVTLRKRAISVFFKSFVSPSEEIVASAKAGLRAAIHKTKLPKDLLQNGLRPILQNLADHKKLTLDLLRALGHLLELLSNWFNITLGEKLMEHLKKWLEPEKLVGPSGSVKWRPGEEAKIAAATLELFHKLPDAAVKFLETQGTRPGLVVLVIQLEAALPMVGRHSELMSPYLPPLALFLSRYAQQGARYFLDRLDQEEFSRRLVRLLPLPEAEKLRDEVAENAIRIAQVCFGSNRPEGSPEPPYTAQYAGVRLIRTLHKLKPGWLAQKPDVVAELRKRWLLLAQYLEQLSESQNPDDVVKYGRLPMHFNEGRWILKMLIDTVRDNHRNLRMIVDIVRAVGSSVGTGLAGLGNDSKADDKDYLPSGPGLLPDLAFLRDFLREVSNDWPVDDRANVVQFVLFYAKESIAHSTRGSPHQFHIARMLDAIVLPMLETACARGDIEAVVSKESVEFLMKYILGGPDDRNLVTATSQAPTDGIGGGTTPAAATGGSVGRDYDEVLRIQLLRLSTLLIRSMPTPLTVHRRELLRFSWELLKNNDPLVISSQWAFLNVAYFMSAYQMPEKQVVQVFYVLVQRSQSEARELVRRALDVLTPALVVRIPHTDASKHPIWIHCAKKVLVDEGHNLAHLLHVWQLVVRHPDLFYPSRAQFVTQVINSLSRLGLPQNAPNENRRLTLDLVELVLRWEAKANAEDASQPEHAAATAGAASDEAAATEMDVDELNAGSNAAPDGKSEDAAKDEEEEQEEEKEDDKEKEAAKAGAPRTLSIRYFRLTQSMMGLILNFLIRMAFNTVDPRFSSDRELRALKPHVFRLLKMTLKLWPNRSEFHFAYLERLMAGVRQQQQQQQHQQAQQARQQGAAAVPNAHEMHPALVTGVEILFCIIVEKPKTFIPANIELIEQSIGPCFMSQNVHVQDVLCKLIKQVYLAFPPDVADSPARSVHKTIESEITRLIASATGAGNTAPHILHGVTCSLRVLKTISEETSNPAYTDRFLGALTKMVFQYAHDLSQSHGAAPHHIDGEGAQSATSPYAVIRLALELGAKRVLRNQEQKKLYLQAMVLLITEKGTDPLCHLQILQCVREWVLPYIENAKHARANLTVPTGALLALPSAEAAPGGAAEGEDAIKIDASTDGAGPASDTPMEAELQAADGKTGAAGAEASATPTVGGDAVPLKAEAGNPDGARNAVAPSASGAAVDPQEASASEPDMIMPGLKINETVLFFQRLAQLERSGNVGSVHAAQWEEEFLKIVYMLCTKDEDEDVDALGGEPYPNKPQAVKDREQLRTEVYHKVECLFLLGFRARNPDTRHRFFELHQSHIGQSLFARLQYIIHEQDWEALAGTFWLQQGIDILLAILVEGESIALAPNSAHMPCPLPKSSASLDTVPELQPPAGKDHEMDVAEEVEKEKEKEKVTPRKSKRRRASSKAEEAPAEDEVNEKADPPEKEEAPPTDGVPAAAAAPQEVPSDAKLNLEKHAAFLRRAGALRVADLMRPLREVAHADVSIAYHLWVMVFPIVWATLQKDEQVILAKPIITLLSKEHHQRQRHLRPNVVQALLEGVSLSQPQPKIPSELIKFLGKTYNAWHISIPLLESHVMLFPTEVRCFDALAELYHLLGENDILFGLWKRRARQVETRQALTLVQHGLFPRAQEVLEGMLKRIDGSGQLPPGPLKAEVVLWEDQWVETARQLNQWEMLSDFAKEVDDQALLMDSLWKAGDWHTLKNDVLLRASAQVEETPNLMMVRACTSLCHNSVPQGEQSAKHGMLLALQRWWQLPELSVCSHIPLLHTFQRLMELQESARVIEELHESSRALSSAAGPQAARSHAYVIKDILETWRLRTPNVWDSLSEWSDLLHWRNHSYNNVISAAKSIYQMYPQMAQLGYKDKAWSVNTLATVARQQGLYDVSVEVLKTSGYHDMVMGSDAFVKIQGQAEAYLEMPDQYQTGLNAINGIDIQYFNAVDKAEIFRLKGCFLEKLNRYEEANQSFSAAVGINVLFSSGWVSWGCFCDRMHQQGSGASLISPQQQQAAAPGPPPPPPPPPLQPPRDQSWLELAVTCILTGVATGSRTGRHYLPRTLHLLSFDADSPKAAAAFSARAVECPMYVWVPWLSQLLHTLLWPHGTAAVKDLLQRIVLHHPQGMYYQMRTLMLDQQDLHNQAKREEAAAKEQVSEAAEGATPNAEVIQMLEERAAGVERIVQPALECIRTVHETIRKHHGLLTHELEQLIKELTTRFSPGPEERLLQIVHALLNKCWKAYPQMKSVPSVIEKDLKGICGVVFNDERSKRFSARYRERFESDLSPSAPAFPTSLEELTRRLKWWRSALKADVDRLYPNDLILEREAPNLAALQPQFLDMPSNIVHLESDADPYRPHRLALIGRNVGVSRRDCQADRRLEFISIDGKSQLFLVQGHAGRSARRDERMSLLLRQVNSLLDRCKESRRRHLSFRVPVVVPIYGGSGIVCHLVEDDASYATLGEAYEVNCARRGCESDLPIRRFVERYNELMTATAAPAEQQNKGNGSGDGDTVMKAGEDGVAEAENGEAVAATEAKAAQPDSGEGSDAAKEAGGEAAANPSADGGKAIAGDSAVPMENDAADARASAEAASGEKRGAAEGGAVAPAPGDAATTDETEVAAAAERAKVEKAKKERAAAMVQQEPRLQAFDEVTRLIVSENVFSQYMYKTLPTCNHLWAFKRAFLAHYALSAFAGHLLLIGCRTPTRLLFARSSGAVLQGDFFPNYGPDGSLENGEPVPFRLTRNLHTFLTEFGVNGGLAAAIGAAAQALLQPHACASSRLALLFRDELCMWRNPSWTMLAKSATADPSTTPQGKHAPRYLLPGLPGLREVVHANTSSALTRAHGLDPMQYAGDGDADSKSNSQKRRKIDPAAASQATRERMEQGANKLIKIAVYPRYLCYMEPAWHPWL